jgi:hypothetical protein
MAEAARAIGSVLTNNMCFPIPAKCCYKLTS